MSIFSEFNQPVIYFSLLKGIPISFPDGTLLGIFHDFFVDYESLFPEVLAIQYKVKKQFYFFEWEDVVSFSYKKIIVKKDLNSRLGKTYPRIRNKKTLTSILAGQFAGKTVDYPPLGKVILDRQIVDISGKKVVRVNDIQLIRSDNHLKVTHAAVGIRSLIRRMGLEYLSIHIFGFIPPLQKVFLREKLINWKYVHTIPDWNIHKDVKLNLSNNELKELHPADLADILEELDGYGRDIIFNELDPEMAAEVLFEIDSDMQASLLDAKNPEEAAEIIEHMSTDEAADILSELSEKEASEIISNLDDSEAKEEIQELLEYEEHTAGGLMTTDFFEVNQEMSREDVINYFRSDHEDIESVYDVYVTDEQEHLLGVCTIRALLVANDGAKMKEIMERDDIKFILPETEWKDIATLMSKYDLATVPVLDSENKMCGIVSIDDVLPWLLNE